MTVDMAAVSLTKSPQLDSWFGLIDLSNTVMLWQVEDLTSLTHNVCVVFAWCAVSWFIVNGCGEEAGGGSQGPSTECDVDQDYQTPAPSKSRRLPISSPSDFTTILNRVWTLIIYLIIINIAIWTADYLTAHSTASTIALVLAWSFAILTHITATQSPVITGVWSALIYMILTPRISNNDTTRVSIDRNNVTIASPLAIQHIQSFFFLINMFAFVVYHQQHRLPNCAATDQQETDDISEDMDQLVTVTAALPIGQVDKDSSSTGSKQVDGQTSQYLAFLAHEMRNPLHAVLGLADGCISDFESVRNQTTSFEEKRKLLLSIRESLQAIKATQLANVETPCTNTSLITQPPIALRTLLQKNIHTTRLAMKSRDISFTARSHHISSPTPTTPPTATNKSTDTLTEDNDLSTMTILDSVKIDSMALLQLLSNLYNNAMKFTPAGGNVDVVVGVLEKEQFEGGGVGMLTPLNLNEKDKLMKGALLYVFPECDNGVLVDGDKGCGDDNRVNDLFEKYVCDVKTKTMKPPPPVSSQHQHHYLQISITDTGTGIPKSAMK
ncbi:hypothetical protein HDU76_002830, partial [Blyttiomyces sp. JEL0837]